MEVLCEKTFKRLGFWATVGGVRLEHESNEMRKEKCTKTNIRSRGGEEKINVD